VEIDQRLANGERGPHGAQGMIGLGQRRVVERHQAVAQELIDRAAVGLDVFDQQHVIAVEHVDQRGRFGVFAEGREALQVGKQHRHDGLRAAQLHAGRVLEQPLDDLGRDKPLERLADLLALALQRVGDLFGAQPRVDARDQLARVKGLGQVVIRTQPQPRHPRIHVGLRGEHDHGDFGRGRVALDRLDHFEPPHDRHVDIQDHQIRRIGCDLLQRHLAVFGQDRDVIHANQDIVDQIAVVTVVFRDQDS